MKIINKDSIAQFQNKLYNETWEIVYQSNEVNVTFNLFLNIYLRAYESCFLKQKVTNKCNNNE
jgi:predicted nucleotidyltransferase